MHEQPSKKMNELYKPSTPSSTGVSSITVQISVRLPFFVGK